jgi:hypothetical protein
MDDVPARVPGVDGKALRTTDQPIHRVVQQMPTPFRPAQPIDLRLSQRAQIGS